MSIINPAALSDVSSIPDSYNISMYLTPSNGMVNEEELFAAVISERLDQSSGSDAVSQFRSALNSHMAAPSKGRPSGYEAASYTALSDLVRTGIITGKERTTILSQSFDAAQLDANKNALWDSIGGKNDTTVATASFSDAIQSANKELRLIDQGKVTPKVRNALLSTESVRTSQEGQGAGISGFLFKPVSNNEGSACVLIPADIGQQVQSVTLQDAAGKTIDTGHFKSSGDTGQSMKYTFARAGGQYPKDCTVVITLQGGETIKVPIADPSQRTQKK